MTAFVVLVQYFIPFYYFRYTSLLLRSISIILYIDYPQSINLWNIEVEEESLYCHCIEIQQNLEGLKYRLLFLSLLVCVLSDQPSISYMCVIKTPNPYNQVFPTLVTAFPMCVCAIFVVILLVLRFPVMKYLPSTESFIILVKTWI